MALDVNVNPLRSLQFGLNSLYKAMQKTNVDSMSESMKMRNESLKITPGEISNWSKMFNLKEIPQNARERFMDIFA